jgi:hypothetical protein
MARMKRNDEAAKIDAEILRMARLVVTQRDVTLAQYLSDLLRPLVKKDFDAEVAKLTRKR